MNVQQFIEKLQGLPEWKRNIILWGVTGLVGAALAVWWVLDIRQSFQNNDSPSLREQLQVDSLGEDLQDIPNILEHGGQ